MPNDADYLSIKPAPDNPAPDIRVAMTPGATATINFPGHLLHGKKVRIERVDVINLAHPDCPEALIAEVIFYSHPSVAGVFGISRERLRCAASS